LKVRSIIASSWHRKRRRTTLAHRRESQAEDKVIENLGVGDDLQLICRNGIVARDDPQSANTGRSGCFANGETGSAAFAA
jgi:hypothetical protein